jgi:SAM-dependent methyltransferase
LNGAYNALLSVGVIPKFYAQLDARPENVNFISEAKYETTFLMASQCAPECFKALDGFDVRTYHLNTPTTRKIFTNEKIYFGGGSTIGTTAMGLAAALGYRRLGIFGYDSSYSSGKSHVRFQPQNANDKTLPIFVYGKEYLSTPTMAKQVEEFRPWLQSLEKTFPGIEVSLFGEGLLYDYIIGGQANTATRESEAAKYTEMYKDPSYAMPQHRADAIREILKDVPRGKLLDVGAGRGETIRMAQELGFPVVAGTETVDALIREDLNIGYGLLPELPVPDKYYDVVTCFEVIEHLLPKDVIPALRDLARTAKSRLIISAATRSDFRSGVELHPSWRSQFEWEETFKAAWGGDADVRFLGNLSSCGLSPVYEYRVRPAG